MPLHSLRVHDDLARFVSQVDVSWSADGDTLDSRTLVAEAGIDLLISVERESGGGARAELFGAKTQPFLVENHVPMWKLRMRLRPGVAPLVLGASAREIRDGQVDLSESWGDAAHALLDCVGEVSHDGERLRAVERALLTRLNERAAATRGWIEAGRLAGHIEAARGDLRISDLCRETGVGARRLERIFRDAIGVTPKLYAQLERFRAAYTTLAAGGGAAEAAFAHGYADQPHLVREFTRFSGASPSRTIR